MPAVKEFAALSEQELDRIETLVLSLSKAIIEAHNGTIEVDSKLGMGTTFTINFPIPTKL